MKRTRSLALLLLLAASPAALAAQDAVPPPAADPQALPVDDENGGLDVFADDDFDEIVVTGARPPGSVQGDIQPELVLNPADIRAYGVSSIAELLAELEPQTGSTRGGGGRPVVLLNGRRIGGFSEIRDLPTEAILRVDILPEEVALTYGYRADQRVVNFVLRPRFRSYTAEIEGRVPTAGGTSNVKAELGLVSINRQGRENFDIEYERSSNLLESERNITAAAPGSPFDLRGNVTGIDGGEIDPALSLIAGEPVTIAGVPGGQPTLADFGATAGAANITDTTGFRTLRPANQRISANAVVARTVLGDVAATGTVRVEATDSTALLGLPGYSLLLPATNPFSPFANDTRIFRFAGVDPLERRSNGLEAEAGFSLNGDIPGNWRWTATGNYQRTLTNSQTERGIAIDALQNALLAGDPGTDPFAPGLGVGSPLLTDTARSVSTNASLNGLINGSLFQLPAGRASTSLRVGLNSLGQDSRSVRSGLLTTNEIGRTRGNVQANIELPVASRRAGVWDTLGDVSLNANAEVEQLSDFGTLTTLGYGLRWSPITEVRLIVSMTHEDGAPSPGQLGNPLIATPNARVFDFVRGETVDITRLDGGNPGLIADSRRIFSAGLTVRPMSETNLTLTANYTNTQIDDPIASFPAATAEIEAAFPDRFLRGPDGRLVQLDNRPINFQSSEREQLRWGVNFSKSIGSSLPRRMQALRDAGRVPEGMFGGRGGRGGAERRQRRDTDGGAPPPDDTGTETETPATEGAPQQQADTGAVRDGRGMGGRRGGGGGGGGGGGRLQFSAYHTVTLKDQVTIRDGVPVLDLLGGSATGSSGGQSRHRVEARAGYSRDGLGARLSANWRSGTFVDGGISGGERLDFSPLATFDLRTWVDLGSQPELLVRAPWLRGSRVTLGVNNIFDARQRVTDANGIVPLSYQPGYVDPLGRTVRVSFRKLFLPGAPSRGALGRGG